jgi:hypothetical protein
VAAAVAVSPDFQLPCPLCVTRTDRLEPETRGGQSMVIGIVGQCAGRIYDEVRVRPLYLVRQARGFAPLSDGARVPPLQRS